MARKITISKDLILQTALDMLIAQGYSSINIKTLAKEIGCSTQPIVWHFDNMEGLRNALAGYALEYAQNKMRPSAGDPIDAFQQVGTAYVQIALNEPNLFRFLYLNGYKGQCTNNFDSLVSDEANSEIIKQLSHHYGISEAAASVYLKNTIIYTHGIASLVATGVIKASEEEMMSLVNQAANTFLIEAGIPADRIP